MFSISNPGTEEQVRQVHNKAQALDGVKYYSIDKDNIVHVYRGTHEGRLINATEIIIAEENIDDNSKEIEEIKEELSDHEERITNLEENKADKCYAIAVSVAL